MRADLPVLELPVELDEDQVPDLQHVGVVHVHQVRRVSPSDPVVMDLTAGTAGTSVTHLPEVILHAPRQDPGLLHPEQNTDRTSPTGGAFKVHMGKNKTTTLFIVCFLFNGSEFQELLLLLSTQVCVLTQHQDGKTLAVTSEKQLLLPMNLGRVKGHKNLFLF